MFLPREYASRNSLKSSSLVISYHSQTFRSPKAVAFPDGVPSGRYFVGRGRVIVPEGRRWDNLFRSEPQLSKMLTVPREQPTGCVNSGRPSSSKVDFQIVSLNV
jgi:antitoxin VapB